MLILDPDTDTPLVAKREELNFFHQAYCSVPNDMTAFEAYCQMTTKTSTDPELIFNPRFPATLSAQVKYD
ncbi:hypothetical protein YERSI8AC_110077 [Enterobacterales bacterium 8AC]|nr:hypothetical protein YERSI8AC_110077 [Enterobacterales bacterium 8AC]